MRRPPARSGISLLEVLAAMLVLTIGILGMARLIPVGVNELAQAYKLDQGSTLGRASFRDLEVRGYLNPNVWYDPAVGAWPLGCLIDQSTGALRFGYKWTPPGGPYPHGSLPPFWTVTPMPFPAAVVIDPLMVTATSPNPNQAPNPSTSHVETFPYGANVDTLNSSAPWIPRVNVMVPNSAGALYPMPYALADRIFRSSDEVSYSDPAAGPASGNQRPTMKFNLDASSNRAQPATVGNDSWFVTVIPSMAEVSTPVGPYPGGNPQSTARQFTVSVVVCNKRDLTLPPRGASVDTPPPGERMLSAAFVAGGIGGGDVLLTAPNASSPNPPLKDWLNVRPGQWIMLSAFVPQQPGTPMAPARIVADWYRIVGVGDVISSNPPQRYVTLHGADFPLAPVGVVPPGTPIFATIVDGVTCVYQKTITLDGSSSWQQ